MAFCGSCGADTGGAAFCPKCGAAQGVVAPTGGGAAAAAPAAPAAAGTSGIEENVAGLLCYIFGWITGLIFLLIDKRPFVRFHGAQAIAVDIAFTAFGIAWAILMAIISAISLAILHFPLGILGIFGFPFVGLLYLAVKLFAIFKAYQHEKFKFPVIGNMVEKMAGA